MPRESLLPLPGWEGPGLSVTRDSAGRLLRMAVGERLHLERRDGDLLLGDGLARMRELATPGRLLRAVHSQGRSWQESYHYDEAGRPTLVDGVAITHDTQGRVLCCEGPDGIWGYDYDDCGHLSAIEPPGQARRALRWDAAGRPIGVEMPPPLDPARFGRDALGRLWTLRDASGAIRHSFLWDGLSCLGRIDGPPDASLACIFSLDLTFTPVRLIARDGVRIVPRDAFGEALLAILGTPGLFGGIIADGMVHLRARALNPRRGAFTAPDPFDGSEDDPRRLHGWRGALPVEPDGARQPFAICRNDPVGRADPTGEISAGVASGLLTLSSLTWSSGTMLVSFFLMDPLNFILGLFTKKFWTEGRWFSKSAMRARYHGGFGFRYDPIGFEALGINEGRAWTVQHVIWAQRKEFDELNPARVFVPATAFRPKLYGSLLRIEAKAADDLPRRILLLHGAQRVGAGVVHGPPIASPEIPPLRRDHAWTRHGGAAEAVVPGARVPIFPSGGLHFLPQTRIPTPRSGARIEEVLPTGEIAPGTVTQRKQLVVKKLGIGLVAAQEAMLTGTASARVLVAFDSVRVKGKETLLFLRADPPAALGTSDLHLRGIRAPTAAAPARATVSLPPGSAPGRLDARPTTADPIALTTPLRLKQAGVEVGAAVVQRLEAAVGIDLAPDRAKGDAPRRIWLAAPNAAGPDRAVTATTVRSLTFPAGTPPPAKGTAITVFLPGAGGAAASRLVTDDPAVDQRVLDRDLPAALSGAVAGALRWRPLSLVRSLGVWDASTGAAEFVYRPEASGTAVIAGPLLVRDDDNTIRQVRDGTGLVRDELVLGTTALPGNPAAAYDVEPLAFDGPERGDARLETITAFTFASPPGASITTAPRPDLALHRLDGAATVAAAPATPLLTALPALAGATITLALPADAAKLVAGSAEATTAPSPGQLVRLAAGAVNEAVLVKAVRLEALANHDPGLGAAALSLVPLMPAGFLYAGEFLAPDRVRLRPEAHRLTGLEPLALAAVAPPTVPVQMPQLAVGEMVRAVWNGVAATALLRVETAEGTVLKLAGGDLAALTAAAPADLKVMRMAPVDPGSGTPFAGINGAVVTAAPARLRFDVWAPNALAARADWYTAAGDATAAAALAGAPALHRWWAVSDGTKSVPIQITATASLAVELYALPASLSGGAAGTMAALHLSDIGLLGDYVLDGSQLTSEELDLTPSPDLVLALPHKAPAAGGVAGKLGSGTVMIPDDETESWYLDRPTALETHELRHTLQCAMMGPLLLGMLPIALIEDIVRATTTLGDPAFSPYVAARIVTDDGLRRLEIPDPGGVTFETDRKIEISAGNQVVLSTLGAADGGGFLVTGSAISQIADGAVQLRQASEEASTGVTALGWAVDISSLLTLGNIASTVGALVFKLIPDLIGGAINVADGKDFFDPYSLDRFPATVPDATRPASVKPEPRGGDTLTLHPHDRVRVSAGERSLDTVVTQVDGTGLADLATAPPVEGAERRLEIAVIGREDPLRRVSTGVVDHLHVPWLRWIYDPYGQLHYETHPAPGSAKEWIFRLSRWAFSSSAWSMVIPGIFIWDNALKQRNNKGHLSRMEQGASSASGDLYSPVARLSGKLDVVGDVARYRIWALSRTTSMIPQHLGDAPGAGTDPGEGDPWIFPRRRGGAPVVPPNADQQADANAAVDVPDVLVQRNLLEPLLLTATLPDRVLPADLARLPAEAGLQRTAGVHVGFSRPGAHRITVGDLPFGADAGEAQTEGRQTILFDKTVGDVTLRAAGRSLAEGDTLKVVPCQRVTFSVAPAAGRRHALLVQRPSDGTLLRRPADLLMQVQTSLGTEVLEVQRVHAVTPFSIEEDKSARWPQAHLLPELRLAVRRLTIEVVNRIDVFASLVPAGAGPLPAVKAFVLPGEEAFLLVPARLHLARPVLAVTYPAGARPANGTDPDPEVRPVTPVPSALAEVVADGAVLRLAFDATDPPEEPCVCEWTLALRAQQPKIGGGTENISANIKASIEYRPHFRLELPVAGDTVAAGASIVLHTSDAVRAGTVVVTPSDGITSSVSADGRDITLTVAAAAAKVVRKVVVEDAATPAHQAKRTILVI